MRFKASINADAPSRRSQGRTPPTRHGLFAAATGLAATLVIALVGTPAKAAEGFAPIVIWNSSHCLDNATQSASRLQVWNCSGATEQNWLSGFNSQTGVFTFTNQHTGRCIAAPAFGDGTVTMAFCDSAASNQQWRVYYAFNPGGSGGWYDVWQNVSSGYCLSTPSAANGTLIQTSPCNPADIYDRWHTE